MRATGSVLHTGAIGRVQEGVASVAHLDHVRSGVLLQHQLHSVTIPGHAVHSLDVHMILITFHTSHDHLSTLLAYYVRAMNTFSTLPSGQGNTVHRPAPFTNNS